MIGIILKIFLILGVSIVGLIGILIFFAIRSENRKKLHHLVISENREKLTLNNVNQLKIKGFDIENREVKLKDVKWEVNEGGTIDLQGKFTAGNEEKTAIIIASVEDIKTEIKINIIKPTLEVFNIVTPNRYTITSTKNLQINIISKDQLGDDLPIKNISWSTDKDYYIDGQNRLCFKSNAKGKYTIQAIANDYNKTASIEINIPTVLTTLKISPNGLRLEPNKPYQFNVEAFDQGGEKMSTIEVKWTCDHGGEITDNGIFTGNLQGEKAVITARLNDVADSVTIQLLPILCSIEINPNYSTIEPRQSIQFSAEGFDQFHREFYLDNLQWYAEEGIINNDGYYQGLSYENEVKITAKSGDIKSSTILTIRDRSRLTTIKIIPEYITINPNSSYQFSVIGLDQRNEIISIDNNLDNIKWNVDEGYINNSGLYSSNEDQQGYYYITAKVKNFTAQATVYIPPIITSLNISPENISLNPEEECQFILQGFDQQNNRLNISDADWRCEFGGIINNRGIFTGGYQRKQVKITAIVDGVKAETVVTILPVLRRLEITPKFIQLKPQETQEFTVKGYDQYKQEISTNFLTWQCEGGGYINQNGLYKASYYDKGEYKVVVSSDYSPKYNKTTRNILFNTGVGMKILGWIISPDTRILEIIKLLLNGSNFSQLSPNYSSQNQSLISPSSSSFDSIISENNDNQIIPNNDYGGDISINNPLEDWFFENIQKKVSKFFSSVGKFCINQANSYVNATAKVEVLPVLRSIEIIPFSPSIIVGSTTKLDIIGLDQQNEIIAIDDNSIESIEWESTDGIIDNGYLSIDGYDVENTVIYVRAKLDDLIAITQVEIKPRKLTTITIIPDQISLKPNESKKFTVKGFDQLKQEIKINNAQIKWETTIGKIDNQGVFTAVLTGNNQKKEVKITATIENCKEQATIKILSISKFEEIKSKFISKFEEIKSKFISKFEEIKSKFISKFKEIKPKFVSKPQEIKPKSVSKPQEIKPKSVSKPQEIKPKFVSKPQKIKPKSVLKKIEISPKSVTLNPEDTQKFIVKGYDQFGQEIRIDFLIWQCESGGKIDNKGVFTPDNHKQEVKITAKAENCIAQANVKILSVLKRLKITPQSVEIESPKNQKFTIQAYDQFDQKINLNQVQIKWETTIGKIDNNGNLTINSNTYKKDLYKVKVTVSLNNISKTNEAKVNYQSSEKTKETTKEPTNVSYCPDDTIFELFDDLIDEYDLIDESDLIYYIDDEFYVEIEDKYIEIKKYREIDNLPSELKKIIASNNEEYQEFIENCNSYYEYKKFH